MKWRHVPILLCLMSGVGAEAVAAQLGPIIDWITGLSGPGMVRVGPQYSLPLRRSPAAGALALARRSRTPELSFAPMIGFKVRDGDGPDGDTSLNMLSGQVTLDVPIASLSPNVSVLAIGGVAGHVFFGDDFDNFGTISFPLQGAIRVRTGGSVTLRFGAGINVFRFPSDAFAPLDLGVERDSWEAAFGTQFVLLFRI